MNCIHCNSTNSIKNGFVRGRQRFLCKHCAKTFINHSRNFIKGEQITTLFEELLNSDETSIDQFVLSHQITKSTFYKHLKIAGYKFPSAIKSFCQKLLTALVQNTNNQIAKEIKISTQDNYITLVLKGKGQCLKQTLFEFRPIKHPKQLMVYNAYKIMPDAVELIHKGTDTDIINHIRRHELDWLVKKAEIFRIEVRKNNKVYM